MGDVPFTPFSLPPPPPPRKSNIPVLYYGLVVVGTAAIVLAIYNLVVIKWCTSRRQRRRPPISFIGSAITTPGSQSFQLSSRNLLGSFKYKKDSVGGEYECPVCLSDFEEGEEVRQLPPCNHSFHAICIDMWLFSHSDCPLCRAEVDPPPPVRLHTAVDSPPEHSREGLLGNSSSV